MVGIAEHVGHIMTYRIFDPETRKILNRGNLRAADPSAINKRIELISGENLAPPLKSIVKSIQELDAEAADANQVDSIDDKVAATEQGTTAAPVFNPEDLIGRTFLLKEQENGERYRARIVEAITGFDDDLGRNPTRIKFKLSINGDQFEELMAYNEVMQHLEPDNDDTYWKFRRILSVQGPLKPKDKGYKGCAWNVLVKWENGEKTAEPLRVF
jgi:hypothetical protein